MAKKGMNNAGTDAQSVRAKNQASAQGQSQYQTEFASETNAQQVRQQNAKSQQKKRPKPTITCTLPSSLSQADRELSLFNANTARCGLWEALI